MRSILLYIHDDDCLEARLQVALDLCRQFDGHLTCLQAVPYDLGVAGDFYFPVATQVTSQLHQAAEEVRERIEPRLAKEDVRWDWIYSDGLASHQIPRHAPLHELLVVGAHNPTGNAQHPSKLVSELVSQMRAPILVVPASTRGFSLDVPAAVAWNGSPEGAHALRAASPLLARASQVHILTVGEDKDIERFDLPATEAAQYLARHGIEAEIVELPANAESSIADVLNEGAEHREAAYLVMGAYGHSRFRERILGGVTRDMLRDPKIPLLLSH